MGQTTSNIIAIIKVGTIGLAIIIGMVGMLYLAATHDGDYGKVIVQQFPYMIAACLTTFGVLRWFDTQQAIAQIKATGTATSPTPEQVPPIIASATPVPAPAPIVPPADPVSGN